MLLSSLVASEGGTKKVVFDLVTGDLAKFESRFLKGVAHNASYYEGKFEELDVIVVIHGDAYKFFIKDLAKTSYKGSKIADLSEIQKRITSLVSTYKVELLMCKQGMEARKIAKDNVLDVVKSIPNAMIGLIDAQNDGYAFVPIN